MRNGRCRRPSSGPLGPRRRRPRQRQLRPRRRAPCLTPTAKSTLAESEGAVDCELPLFSVVDRSRVRPLIAEIGTCVILWLASPTWADLPRFLKEHAGEITAGPPRSPAPPPPPGYFRGFGVSPPLLWDKPLTPLSPAPPRGPPA